MSVSPAANAIITVADVQSYLKMDASSVTDEIQSAINHISDRIERYVRGYVVQRSVTLLLDGNGRSEMALPLVPVFALEKGDNTDVAYRNDPTETNWIPLELEAKYIMLDPIRPYKVILYRSIFPVGLRNIQIAAKIGYPTGSVPGVFKAVAIEAVTEWYRESGLGQARLGMRSKSTSSPASPSVSDSYMQLIFDRHMPMLDPYVWPVMAE